MRVTPYLLATKPVEYETIKVVSENVDEVGRFLGAEELSIRRSITENYSVDVISYRKDNDVFAVCTLGSYLVRKVGNENPRDWEEWAEEDILKHFDVLPVPKEVPDTVPPYDR